MLMNVCVCMQPHTGTAMSYDDLIIPNKFTIQIPAVLTVVSLAEQWRSQSQLNSSQCQAVLRGPYTIPMFTIADRLCERFFLSTF